MMWGWGDGAWWAVEGVFLHSSDKGFGHVLEMNEDLGFAVQFNAETPWPFAQLRYPRVG